MVGFICKKCNYRFESEQGKVKKKCPYCDSEQIVREPDAEGLLKEIEGE